MIRKTITILICFFLLFEQTGFAQIAGQLDLSLHFAGASPVKDKFRPVHLRYLSYDNQANNFRLLLDKGDSEKLAEGTVPAEGGTPGLPIGRGASVNASKAVPKEDSLKSGEIRDSDYF